ncbi:MAG: hypothetical protein MJ184_07040 [Treponema sp.]|uniref:hypothetical protein n=1 Tax=Treponema sp. TaxID=166 RepID=UPI00298E7B5E|nr:hypothetical protein [Treponema sp.]MCQ2601101.1 hypothetical protein [Treponema sp.]
MMKPGKINLKVLSDLLSIKNYRTSFMQCASESEITLFITIPKEDIMLISGLKDFQTFYSEIITNLYRKKKINNNYALNDYLDFNLSLLFIYSPLALENNNDDNNLWEMHTNSITVFLNYNEQENEKLDYEFEKIQDYIEKNYKEINKIKYESFNFEDYFLEGNENYEQRELFEKIINTLFFQKYKMTVYEFLLETTYRINIEEVDEKIKNHLQRIHRQVLFEAYEDMISKNNK